MKKLRNYHTGLIFLIWFVALVPTILFRAGTIIFVSPAHHGRLVTMQAPIILILVATYIIIELTTKKNHLKQLAPIALILIIPLISTILSGNNRLALAFILALSFINLDLKKLMRFDLILRFIFIPTVIALTLLGLVENRLIGRSGGAAYRYALGFSHPNTLGMYVLSLCLGYLYIKYDSLKKRNYFVVMILGCIMFYYTRSNTSFILIGLSILLVLVFKRWNILIKSSQTAKVILLSFMPFMALLSFLSAIFYNPGTSFWRLMNRLTTGRTYFNKLFLDNYGVSLFGQQVHLVSGGRAETYGIGALILDNAYMSLAINFGIVSLVLLILASVLLIRRSLIFEDYGLLVAILIFSILGLMETGWFDIRVNWTLLSVASLFEKD